MTRKRGRPVVPIPVHPERVISRAVKAGLSATIVLQRDISNKNTRKYYERSHERWSIRQRVYQVTKDQGKPDFSHVSKAEAHIRKDMRLMFYENAAKYGFTEVSRQKNADDTVNPINQRLNACGRVVRENSEVMFPMPEPISFGTYTRRDGKGRKKYRRAGYEGSSFGPKVILAHPDLPSLDFGDAVRSHNEYLATFCAIHNVPVRETARYSHLFYLLVRPYLEYLYSEFKCGKSNFQKGINWALRQVKELVLEAGYRPTIHEGRTVTSEPELEESTAEEENKRFFKGQEMEARKFYGDHPAVVELNRLMGNLGEDGNSKEEPTEEDEPIFTVKDVEHIRKEAARRARIAGSIMHRRIADLFPSPWHLNDVILSGDRYAHSSDYVIISEVPMRTSYGAGKVDLILCERVISDDGKRVFWKPVLILEIKTRLGQSWYVEADYKESEVRPDGSPLQRVVSEFPLRDCTLSDALWDPIVKSTPTPRTQKQLGIYCQALDEIYKDATQQELSHVLRGVVVIDSSSDITEVRKVLEHLIVYGYESVKNRVRKVKRTVYTPPKSESYRIALVLDEQPGPRRKDTGLIRVPWIPVYTPFKAKKEMKRKFLLYLTGHSSTSAGQSAAWNSQYYHGLQLLYEMKQAHEKVEFVWIDLASQFNESQLAEARLRLRPRGYSEDEIAKVQSDHIREFFESIKITGHMVDVLSFLFQDGEVPSFELKTRRSKRKVIIVTGADVLRDGTPTSHRGRLSEFLGHLLSSFPDDEKTTIVWFDSPVPSVEKATPYSTRALLPYFETSPLGNVITDIVWNLPIAPRGAVQPEKWGLSIIGDSPMHDDIRVVIRHSAAGLQTELVHIPFLRGWSKRFRNKGTGLVVLEQEIDDVVPEKTVRDRMKLLALTMLPWLSKLWPHKALIEESAETLERQSAKLNIEFRGSSEKLTIAREVLAKPLSKPPSLLDLLKFRIPETMDALSYQVMTAGKINSQRLYRSPRKLQTQPLQTISEPQSIQQVPAFEEGLEQEWVFGVKFESDDEDILPWWMVVQDPTHPSRLLVGCFVDRPLDKDGFLWAESRQEALTQSSLDEILGSSQIVMIGRRIGEGLQLWTSRDEDEPVYFGELEVKGRGRSTIGHLRAIRQTFTEEPLSRPPSTARPSESFYKRMVDSLQKQLIAVTSPTPVKIHLVMIDGVCHIALVNYEDDTVQRFTIEYTADLISLLRWPTNRGGPMFTNSGEYASWSIFDDIDYGELDFIRPYVTYTAARMIPEELPRRVSQFFDEAESLSVSLSHDASVCPLVSGEAVKHGACWRIEIPADCPNNIRKQLGRTLTGEEVNGFLAPGRLYAGKLYNLDITLPTVSEMDESVVFHEERYIRLLLRSRDLPLRRLPAGTFLHVAVQQWKVSIEWDGMYFKWQARSDVSTLPFRGDDQTVELVHGHGAQEECNRLLEIITSQIPSSRIFEYPGLRERVLSGLKNRGYSKTSPTCELRIIEQSGCVFRFGVFLVDGSQRKPLHEYSIETTGAESSDVVLEEVMTVLNEGEASACTIRNTESFMGKLGSWMSEHVQELEEISEEPVEYEVMLSIDDKGDAILWKAEVYGAESSRNGILYDDLKVLLNAGIRETVREMREIFERDVVSQLGVVCNHDDVIKQQIPEMIRSIRRVKY